MYKVILVDDEELIIEGMKQLTDWQQLGCEIAGVAYDGDEALDIINETAPDIVITDIRMPAMNGLEMIDYVKERFPDIVIMIMSGYSDFEYAHQALEKGAACYMLKPVLEKDLAERIRQTVEQLDQKLLKQQEEKELSLRLHQLKRGAKENFLRNLMREEMTASYIGRIWNSMELCRPGEKIRLAVLESDTPLSDAGESVIKFAIDNISEEICHQYDNLESVSLGEDASLIFMLYDNTEEDTDSKLDGVIDAIQDTVYRFCKVRLSAGLSSGYLFPQEVRTAYTDACNALEKRFYAETPERRYQGKVVRQERSVKDLRLIGEKLLSAVKNGENRSAELYLGQFCHVVFGPACLEIEEIHNEIKRMLMRYQDILLEYQEDHRVYENTLTFQIDDLYRFKTGKALRCWFEGATHSMLKTLEQHDDSADLIQRIKHYIQKNYQTVSRQNTADYFFINPSYLSQLFKAETGEVFTDYVTRIRMEKAKQMLAENRYKIQYIAELVGYTSNQHFTRTFKKYTGVLPVEYKKQMQQGDGI